MPNPSPLNPILYQRPGQVVTLSNVPALLEVAGLVSPYGPAFGLPQRGPSGPSIGVPFVGGLNFLKPQNVVPTAETLLQIATDQELVQIGQITYRPVPFLPAITIPIKQLQNPDAAPPLPPEELPSSAISNSNGGGAMLVLTMLFQQQNGRAPTGWTESYGLAISTLDPGILQNIRVSFFIQARLGMLATGVEHVGSRFTLLPDGPPPIPQPPNQSLIQPGTSPQFDTNGQPFYNPLLRAFDTDFAGTIYQLRLRTAPTDGVVYSRRLIFSGLPDAFDTPLNSRMLPGPWGAAVSRFEAQFVGNGAIAALRSFDRSAGFPNLLCTGIDVTGLIYTVPLHGFVNRSVVNASRFKITKGGIRPAGLYRVLVIDANTFSLQGALPATKVSKLGYFRVVSWLSVPFAAIIDRSFANKKRGRPFGLSVGKRSKILGVRS